MECYLVIDIDKDFYLNYWSNDVGWTYYRNLATEYDTGDLAMPIGNKVMIVKSEKL